MHRFQSGNPLRSVAALSARLRRAVTWGPVHRAVTWGPVRLAAWPSRLRREGQPARLLPGGWSGRLRLAAAAVLLTSLAAAGLADYSSGGGGYVVQPGDSLWAIATSHGISVTELASANHLDPNAILPIGRQLYIPASSSGNFAGTAVTVAAVTPAGAANPWTFCSDFVASPGPYGVLPPELAASPERLALEPVFEEWASHYGLSLPLLEAVDWQESGWQESVVSSTGAVGVGQIMPGTGSFISGVLIGEPMDMESVSDNIRMSAAFLAYLAQVEGGNRCATIAAYYEGPLNLSADGVYPSTRTYVADVEALLPRFE